MAFGAITYHGLTKAGSNRIATAIGRATVRGGARLIGSRAALTGARFLGSAGLAVAAPVAAGYAVSYGIAGKEGASDFHDYITGGVSPKEWWDTVTLKSLR